MLFFIFCHKYLFDEYITVLSVLLHLAFSPPLTFSVPRWSPFTPFINSKFSSVTFSY